MTDGAGMLEDTDDIPVRTSDSRSKPGGGL
jgi:hypothetical protein